MFKNNDFKISIISAVLILVIYSNSYSQTPAYAILEKEISARAAGMSGSFSSISGDAYSLFYNPAGLIGSQDNYLGLTYINDILDINTGQLVYTSSKNTTKYGFGVNFTNYGDFDGFDVLGNSTGSFNANDVLFVGGIARSYSESIYWGVSGKFLYSQIDEFSSTVLLADLGLLYRLEDQDFNLGVTISNFGFVASEYIDESETIPTSVKVGANKKLEHAPILISLEYRGFFEGDAQYLGGVEVYFSDTFSGRGGYNSFGTDQEAGDDNGTLPGVSLGFGLKFDKYILDYAFTSMGVLGNLNMFTISWNIN